MISVHHVSSRDGNKKEQCTAYNSIIGHRRSLLHGNGKEHNKCHRILSRWEDMERVGAQKQIEQKIKKSPQRKCDKAGELKESSNCNSNCSGQIYELRHNIGSNLHAGWNHLNIGAVRRIEEMMTQLIVVIGFKCIREHILHYDITSSFVEICCRFGIFVV